MAIIAPFKGLTYDFRVRNDFEKLTAPPYDVISPAEQEALHAMDPFNVVRLILGKAKTGDSDWDNRYTRAADYFRRWESMGVLVRARRPHLYLTSLSYSLKDGQTQRTRWGVIGLVRIEEPETGAVLPHERTFSAHKDDRLKLMRACHAQLSQVFGLFEDGDGAVIQACRQAAGFTPHVSFDFIDGTRHRMWCLDHPDLFADVASLMSKKPILIADGHHRYETARNYRNLMRARYGRRPENRAYEFVMMYLTHMNDEGLTILPSHRMIKRVPDFQLKRFLETAEKWFAIERVPFPGADVSESCSLLKQRLARGRHRPTFGFYRHEARKCYVLSLKEGAIEALDDDLHPSLKQLDVVVLSRLILQRTCGFKKEDLDNEEIFHYESSMEAAVARVLAGEHQMTFLLNPTRIEQVKEVAGHGLVMPRKSTYFYPKVLTGLVFNKIDPDEIIQAPGYGSLPG